jgi:hypothetical protein
MLDGQPSTMVEAWREGDSGSLILPRGYLDRLLARYEPVQIIDQRSRAPVDMDSLRPRTLQLRSLLRLRVRIMWDIRISEIRLFTRDGVLFARKVRTTPLLKTEDMHIVGNWTINYQ